MVSISRQEIVRSLELLSATADDQIRYLREFFGCDIADDANVDELALQFDDANLTRETLFENGELSRKELECLLDLDAFLESISGQDNADLWTVEALRARSEWKGIRDKARKCLALLSEGP